MKREKIPMVARILIAMAIGMATGMALGPRAGALGDLGGAMIQAIKTLAIPLLFFAVIDAFLKTELQGRMAMRMAGIFSINGALALAIGLALSNLFQPGLRLSMEPPAATGAKASTAPFDLGSALIGSVPKSLIEPFAESSVIEVVLLAVLFGLALRAARREHAERFKPLEDAISAIYRTIEIALHWIIRWIPVAVFGVTAKTIGEKGFAPLAGLAAYVGVALLGLAIQILIVYQAWIRLVARRSLGEFWKGAREPFVYALGASSSLATLPVTLNALAKMKVRPAASRMSACIGTNLNNDGILLYEAMAVLFVAQAYGMNLSLGDQAMAMLACLFAGIGVAGIPDAGLISLSMVLGTVGLPTEILPLLLTVDWLLSRARAATNVIGDVTGAVVLDRTD